MTDAITEIAQVRGFTTIGEAARRVVDDVAKRREAEKRQPEPKREEPINA